MGQAVRKCYAMGQLRDTTCTMGHWDVMDTGTVCYAVGQCAMPWDSVDIHMFHGALLCHGTMWTYDGCHPTESHMYRGPVDILIESTHIPIKGTLVIQ
jgi:hypothetical protein